ncbi:MAG: diguanylate cyclase [Solirubrobacterales bacterium]|nr:diguanylate cyclase [Solirubrobacterales bacterium]
MVITAVAFAISLVGAEDPKLPLFFAGWAVGIACLGLAWLRPKFWIVAPFGALAGAILIRAGSDGLDSGIGPLLLIPVLAIAVYGSRWALTAMVLTVVVAVLCVHFATDDTAISVSSVWRQDVVMIILATVLAIAIQDLVTRMRRERNLAEERGLMIERLSDVTRRIATSVNGGDTLCQVAIEETPASGAALFSFDLNGNRGLIAARGGVTEMLDDLAQSPVLRNEGQIERRFGAGDPEMVEINAAFAEVAPDLVICRSVTSEKREVGTLLLAYSDASPDSGIPLELLAAEASIAIRHHQVTEQLEHLATTDPLTSIDNRRGWERMIQRALGQARRHGQPLCLAMLDLDHFKEFNDAYGHQAGDDFLREAASSWEEMIRIDDHIARYGGEEFVLTLPNTDLEGARKIVDRLRAALPDYDGDPDKTTCSAGIASWNGSETVRELVARADQALYLAKEGGRNKTVVSPDGT